MDKDKDNKTSSAMSMDEEWDFSKVEPTSSLSVRPEPQQETQTKIDTKQDKTSTRTRTRTGLNQQRPEHQEQSNTSRLSLDESNVPKTKTRTEMAAALTKNNTEDEEVLSYEIASPVKRALAFIFDLIYLAGLGGIVYFSVPVVRKLMQLFLDRYNLQFIFPEPTIVKAILIINAVIAFFCFVIVPVSFYHKSFGKKMFKLKVKNEVATRISLELAMQRELVYKPLSILILIGFFIPLFNKKKQSLHDFLAETVVVEEQ